MWASFETRFYNASALWPWPNDLISQTSVFFSVTCSHESCVNNKMLQSPIYAASYCSPAFPSWGGFWVPLCWRWVWPCDLTWLMKCEQTRHELLLAEPGESERSAQSPQMGNIPLLLPQPGSQREDSDREGVGTGERGTKLLRFGDGYSDTTRSNLTDKGPFP